MKKRVVCIVMVVVLVMLRDVYDDVIDGVGTDHDAIGSMQCVMEYFSAPEAQEFYDRLIYNNYELAAEAYCDSCYETLCELMEAE